MGSSELQTRCRGHHRRGASLNGGDDLLDVDGLQVDAGGAEVGVPELALHRSASRCVDGVRLTALGPGRPTDALGEAPECLHGTRRASSEPDSEAVCACHVFAGRLYLRALVTEVGAHGV